jgi:FMN-dependent oxidoreductase (nitrilotriacetate monooxygenase family)
MTRPSRRLHLNAFLMAVGHHEAAWRQPAAAPERAFDLEHYVELAQIAEAAAFDSVFFADTLSAGHAVRHNLLAPVDPLSLLFALAARTDRIGLIATVSTTYTEPYATARRLATLDHLSHGRAGWNIVTSGTEAEAANHGHHVRLDHARRYERADEFLEVATALWDSWEDGALVADKPSGVYADTDLIHEIDHDGEWFRVRGPLNVPRSPQGWPLLVQAGSSRDGTAFAARWADAVFTAHQSLAGAQAFYAGLKAQTVAAGRDPDDIAILPGLAPIIGSTEAEARSRQEALTDAIVVPYALRQLSNLLEHDVTDAPIDGPLPRIDRPIEEVIGGQSRAALIIDVAEREQLTIREILGRLGAGRGHFTLAGTPEQVADHIETWFRDGAADGFNIMPPTLPDGLRDFAEHVVPLLQQRGLFRAEYEADTLRGHYGAPQAVTA